MAIYPLPWYLKCCVWCEFETWTSNSPWQMMTVYDFIFWSFLSVQFTDMICKLYRISVFSVIDFKHEPGASLEKLMIYRNFTMSVMRQTHNLQVWFSTYDIRLKLTPEKRLGLKGWWWCHRFIHLSCGYFTRQKLFSLILAKKGRITSSFNFLWRGLLVTVSKWPDFQIQRHVIFLIFPIKFCQ